MFKKSPHSKKGFSLVELLVVIGIIGLMAGIILPNIATVRARGRDSKRVADISQLRLALEHYFNLHDKYPLNIYTDTTFKTDGVISSVPTDPNSGVACTTGGEASCYLYRAICAGGNNAAPDGFHLGATFEQNNEQLGSDKDATAVSVCTPGSLTPDFDGTESPTLKTCTGTVVTTGGCYDYRE